MTELGSRDAKTKGRRGPRCYLKGYWKHRLWQRFAPSTWFALRCFPIFVYKADSFCLGAVIQMQKGDILGHEFCGKVESFGSGVKNLKVGQRVVASFQIACGSCMYCDRKLSSQCEKTNDNSTEMGMYGGNTAGESVPSRPGCAPNRSN